jgi:predicted permease
MGGRANVVITDVILPIAFIILLGFLLRRFGGRYEHAFSKTQLYILGPALLFSVMARNDTGYGLIFELLIYVAILSAGLLLLTQGIGLLAGGDRAERNAMSLAGVFTNSGFYGIPVCMLAFGEEGLKWAALYVVASATVQSTLGIFLASSGKQKATAALLTVFKVPLIWAIIAGRVLADLNLLPSEPFMEMIDLLGRSAIPLGLLLLGMQLERIITGDNGDDEAVECADEEEEKRGSRRIVALGISSGMIKIFGGLGIALVVLRFFDLDPVLRNVMLVQSAMPTAVNAVVYATEFDCRPRLVAIGIFSSTLISVGSITLILSFLV